MEIGATFSTKQDLKNTLMMLNSATGCNIIALKNDKTMYTVTCAEQSSQGCKWRLHARCHDGTWIVKTLIDDHQCMPTKQSRLTFGFKELIPIFQMKIKDTPCCPPGEMVKILKRDHNMDIEYHVCYRAKQAILNYLNSELRKNYSLLKRFLTVFNEKSHGNFVQVQDTDGASLRAFSATAASISAFKYLRPLVSVDGTHMRTQAKGVLLCAAGIDAIGQVVPLCYALVDVECFDNWDWFFCGFKEAFRITDMVSCDLMLLSDRQKGLIKVVVKRFPLSAHGMRVNHLKENLKEKVNKQSLNQKVFELAKAKTGLEHEAILEQIESISVIAPTYLSEVDKSHYVDAFFSGKRFGQYTSNISESLNSVILPERGEFPFQALQSIIHKYAEVFQQRSDKYPTKSTGLPSELTKKVQSLLSTSRSNYRVHQTAPLAFELVSPSNIYIVDLEAKTCTCRHFQDSLFPCVHAATPIHSFGLQMVDFIAPCCYTTSLQQVYSVGTIMVSTEEMLAIEQDKIRMPPHKRLAGHPELVRKCSNVQAKARELHCEARKGFQSSPHTPNLTKTSKSNKQEKMAESRATTEATARKRKCRVITDDLAHAIDDVRTFFECEAEQKKSRLLNRPVERTAECFGLSTRSVMRVRAQIKSGEEFVDAESRHRDMIVPEGFVAAVQKTIFSMYATKQHVMLTTLLSALNEGVATRATTWVWSRSTLHRFMTTRMHFNYGTRRTL